MHNSVRNIGENEIQPRNFAQLQNMLSNIISLKFGRIFLVINLNLYVKNWISLQTKR